MIDPHLAAGPTPFPTTDAGWPGKGPTKVYPYMNDNRNYFWSVRDQNQGKVVFVGDSLMGGWKDLPGNFPDISIANCSIGGETSRNLLFRLREDALNLHPKALVILIGANDLSAYGDPDDTISNLKEIVRMAHKQNPAMPIVICTTPPRNDPKLPTQPGKQGELNSKIKTLKLDKVQIVDIYPPFLRADGTQDPRYYEPDCLHFLPAGYVVFRRALKPVLDGLLLNRK